MVPTFYQIQLVKNASTGNELVGSGGGGGSIWTTSGSNIHYNSTNRCFITKQKVRSFYESKFIGNVIIGSSSGSTLHLQHLEIHHQI